MCMDDYDLQRNFSFVSIGGGGFCYPSKHSHLFHTRWRAENNKKDMEEQGCQNVKINAYKAILVEG